MKNHFITQPFPCLFGRKSNWIHWRLFLNTGLVKRWAVPIDLVLIPSPPLSSLGSWTPYPWSIPLTYIFFLPFEFQTWPSSLVDLYWGQSHLAQIIQKPPVTMAKKYGLELGLPTLGLEIPGNFGVDPGEGEDWGEEGPHRDVTW